MPTLPSTTTVTDPRQAGYDGVLGTLPFHLAPTPDHPLVVQTSPPQAPRISTSELPEEFADESGLTFARSDFTGGQGLYRAHQRGQDNTSARYWDSKGIDIRADRPGELPVIQLARGLSSANNAIAAGVVRLATNGSRVYVTDGNNIEHTTAPAVADPLTIVWTSENPHGAEGAVAAQDVTCYGSETFAALGVNGVHKRSTAGVWAHYNDVVASRVWAVANRLFIKGDGADENKLYELATSGAAAAAPSPKLTIAPGHIITDVVNAGSAVIVSATDGYLYAFQPDASSVLQLVAQTSLEHEQILSLGVAHNTLLVGSYETTATGRIGYLWRGTVLDSGVVDDLQLLRQWGDQTTTLESSPRRIITTRNAAYIAVIENVPGDGTETTVWRYDLATAALSRQQSTAQTGRPYGLVAQGGNLFVGVEGYGVMREHSGFYVDGWLMGPLGDFYTAADKSWVSARLDGTVPGQGGLFSADLDLYYTVNPLALLDPDHADWEQIVTAGGYVFTDDNLNRDVTMTGVASRYIAGMIRMSPYGQLVGSQQTPTARSFGFRGLPQSEDVVVRLPVQTSDTAEYRSRQPVRAPGVGQAMVDALIALRGTAITLTLYRPSLTLHGTVEQVQVPVPAVTRNGSPTFYAEVTFRGRQA